MLFLENFGVVASLFLENLWLDERQLFFAASSAPSPVFCLDIISSHSRSSSADSTCCIAPSASLYCFQTIDLTWSAPPPPPTSAAPLFLLLIQRSCIYRNTYVHAGPRLLRRICTDVERVTDPSCRQRSWKPMWFMTSSYVDVQRVGGGRREQLKGKLQLIVCLLFKINKKITAEDASSQSLDY